MSLSIFILTLLSAEACSGLHFSAVIIAKLSNCFVSDIFCFDINFTLTHNLCTFATINKINLLI